MHVPFHQPYVQEEEIKAVAETLRSGWLTSGPNVEKFEAKFARFVNAQHAIAVSSATIAMALLIQAMRLEKDDEIAFPTYTFSGPAMMAHNLGMKVKLIDSAPEDFHPSTVQVMEGAKDSFAFVPTHFAGRAFDVQSIARWAKENSIAIIDDAAHAFPTRYPDASYVGTGTNATFFSFYATKTLTTMDGGMITTDHEPLAARLRKMRLHGFDRDARDRYTDIKSSWVYDVSDVGWKANMPDPAAAMGKVQLTRARTLHEMRRKIAARYTTVFMRNRNVRVPIVDQYDAAHLYPLRVPMQVRDVFIEKMKEREIHCSVHFIPLHRHSFWQKTLGITEKDFPHADRLFKQEVSLPIWPGMSDEQVTHVITSTEEILQCLLG